MKLSEKTIQKIINDLSENIPWYLKRLFSLVAKQQLNDLNLTIKPYDSSQSTLVISGENE